MSRPRQFNLEEIKIDHDVDTEGSQHIRIETERHLMEDGDTKHKNRGFGELVSQFKPGALRQSRTVLPLNIPPTSPLPKKEKEKKP